MHAPDSRGRDVYADNLAVRVCFAVPFVLFFRFRPIVLEIRRFHFVEPPAILCLHEHIDLAVEVVVAVSDVLADDCIAVVQFVYQSFYEQIYCVFVSLVRGGHRVHGRRSSRIAQDARAEPSKKNAKVAALLLCMLRGACGAIFNHL